MTSLVSAENSWALWAIMVGIAAFAIWAEQKTTWGSRLSGCMVALLCMMLLSNIGIVPVEAPAYDVVWGWVVPLAIPLLLFKADLVRIFKETGPTLLAFCIGAVGTSLGAIVAAYLVNIGPQTWKMAGVFASTYIGGTLNYVAVSKALKVSSDILSAGVAADNVNMTIYFLLLFAIPGFSWARRLFKTPHIDEANRHALEMAEQGKQEASAAALYWSRHEISLLDISVSASLAFAVAALGNIIASAIGVGYLSILFNTGLIVIIASVFPKQVGNLAGAQELGTFLMHIFFAVIGAAANIPIIIRVGPKLFAMAITIIIVHMIIILAVSKLFRLNLEEILIASNANIGGPTTASAMAITLRWNSLILPAILAGIFGYAIASYLGVGLAYLIKGMLGM